MDLYTLSETFLAKDVVEEFVSAIWTERFTAAGDFQIVVPITSKNLELLAEGTYLGLRGSQEVMQVETLSFEKGLMTVAGSSLLRFLNHRFVWQYNPNDSVNQLVANYVEKNKPGQVIANLVTKYAIAPTSFPTDWADANLSWENESIPYLTVGAVDTSGEIKQIEAPVGPLYDAISQIAGQNSVGIALHLVSADPVTGYSLQFKSFQGRDLTSGQTLNPLVRLTLDEGISEYKELRSMVAYKNVVYVFYGGKISKHLADPEGPEPIGLDRRILIVDDIGERAPAQSGSRVETSGIGMSGSFYYLGLSAPKYLVTYSTPGDIVDFRNRIAADALANHNFIRAVDGQASPMSAYKYGADYELGDILELEAFTGTVSKARITEYIRSQDQNGDRAYPTISVVA